VALRTLLQRRKRLAAARRQRQMALPGIAGGNAASDQSALFEVAQHAAQISGIEVERAADATGRRRMAAGDLVKHARLAKRIGAVEIGLAQHAEPPRVEAVEPAHGGDPLPALLACRHVLQAEANT